jgi:hypothetical protein
MIRELAEPANTNAARAVRATQAKAEANATNTFNQFETGD